jgi:hypothetical protein
LLERGSAPRPQAVVLREKPWDLVGHPAHAARLFARGTANQDWSKDWG